MLSEVWRHTLLVFLAVSPVALSLPLVAEAQGVNKTYRIGHVSLMTPDGMAPYVHEFEKGFAISGTSKDRTTSSKIDRRMEIRIWSNRRPPSSYGSTSTSS